MSCTGKACLAHYVVRQIQRDWTARSTVLHSALFRHLAVLRTDCSLRASSQKLPAAVCPVPQPVRQFSRCVCVRRVRLSASARLRASCASACVGASFETDRPPAIKAAPDTSPSRPGERSPCPPPHQDRPGASSCARRPDRAPTLPFPILHPAFCNLESACAPLLHSALLLSYTTDKPRPRQSSIITYQSSTITPRSPMRLCLPFPSPQGNGCFPHRFGPENKKASRRDAMIIGRHFSADIVPSCISSRPTVRRCSSLDLEALDKRP